MGLDMYLNKRVSIYAMYEFEGIDGTIFITKHGQRIPIDLSRVNSISERVAYWRKANAIHKWFVDNVQGGVDDCKEYSVTLDQLRKLLKTCERVIKDHSLATELLPTQEGFYFGSTDYGECYYEDLKYTVKALKQVLKEKYPEDLYVSFTYDSSW